MIDLGRYSPQDVRIDSVDLADTTFQCRAAFDPKAEQEMADSIKLLGQRVPAILLDYGNRKVIVDGFTRVFGTKKAGLETFKAIIIPVGDLKEPEKEAFEIALFFNVQRNNLKDLDRLVDCWRLRQFKCTFSYIARTLGLDRTMVPRYILIQEGGPEIQDAVKKGILPIVKTAKFLAKDIKNPEAGGGGVDDSHPPADDSDKLQIDNEKQAKLLEALKSATPKESAKKLLNGSDAANKSGPRVTSTAKGIQVVCHFPPGTAKTDAAKVIVDAWQAMEDKKAQQAQAKADKLKARPAIPKPDPAAVKAAKDAVNANNKEIDKVTKMLKSALSHANELTKGGRDASAPLKEAETLKAELQTLKAKGKQLAGSLVALIGKKRQDGSKKPKPTQPAPDVPSTPVGEGGDEGQEAVEPVSNVAAEPVLPVDSKDNKQTEAKQASQLLPTPKTKTWDDVQNGPQLKAKCLAEIANQEKELAEAQTEQDKAAKKAALEKSKASFEELKNFFGITDPQPPEPPKP